MQIMIFYGNLGLEYVETMDTTFSQPHIDQKSQIYTDIY